MPLTSLQSEEHMRLVVVVLVFLLTSTLTLPGFAQAPTDANIAKRSKQQDDIREAIFRFQMKDRAGLIFLQIGRRDPSDSFMKRFSDVKLQMRKSSNIDKHKVSHSSIYDRFTGKTGVLLWVGTIEWKSEQNVVVDGGYWCGTLCAGRGDFYVILKDGRWIVEKFDLKIIS